MPFCKSTRPQQSRISAEQLSDFGRFSFLGEEASGIAVQRAVAAARGVDHALFMDRIADAVLDPANYLNNYIWEPHGAARFAEDHLAPRAMTAPGCLRLLDVAVGHLVKGREPGFQIAPELLTPVQRGRLTAFLAVR
jgi:hypothetical protein